MQLHSTTLVTPSYIESNNTKRWRSLQIKTKITKHTHPLSITNIDCDILPTHTQRYSGRIYMGIIHVPWKPSDGSLRNKYLLILQRRINKFSLVFTIEYTKVIPYSLGRNWYLLLWIEKFVLFKYEIFSCY